ncbi:MAG: AtpZ/AtpI family protein [Alphaproteobacteria bacterium]|nr:AtpZ/AtpI family protein [Alphaproteobacteria bacterium]
MDDRKTPPTLEDIEARLRIAQGSAAPGIGGDDSGAARSSGIGMAFRISVEFVSAVAVGVALGWLLDRWLGTKPWFMVVMLFLGAAAGALNVYRVVRGLDSSIGLGQATRRLDK